MATTDVSLLYHYTYYLYGYWYEIQDPRTAIFPLVSVHPLTMSAIMYAYYAFVTNIGPRMLKNRAPFELRTPMFIYNVVMVFVNGFFLVEAIARSNYFRVFLNFDYPSRDDRSPEMMWTIFLGWCYWMSKFADWFDTIFYVLRKKERHINFLHLYHHISVPTFGYLIMKINANIPCVHLFIVINSFVHCCMYSYYALAALGPAVRRWLWWKRYITVMQLGQFAFGIFYGFIIFLFQTGYPVVWMVIGLIQPPFFFWMFYDFYQNTYKKQQQQKSMTATNNNNNLSQPAPIKCE